MSTLLLWTSYSQRLNTEIDLSPQSGRKPAGGCYSTCHRSTDIIGTITYLKYGNWYLLHQHKHNWSRCTQETMPEYTFTRYLGSKEVTITEVGDPQARINPRPLTKDELWASFEDKFDPNLAKSKAKLLR